MYLDGLGIPGDEVEALDWFQNAARKKHITEQYILGMKYLDGEGTPRDIYQAYAWLGIAAAGGFEPAQQYRNDIESAMNDDEIGQARELAREYWEKFGNKETH